MTIYDKMNAQTNKESVCIRMIDLLLTRVCFLFCMKLVNPMNVASVILTKFQPHSFLASSKSTSQPVPLLSSLPAPVVFLL